MKKFYFTFGFDHFDKLGICMGEYYVTVFAESFDSARLTFIEKFMKIYMKNDLDYLWQYDESAFYSTPFQKRNAMTLYEN